MLFSAHAHRLWKRRQFLICLLGRERERRLWCSSSLSVGSSLSGSGLLEEENKLQESVSLVRGEVQHLLCV